MNDLCAALISLFFRKMIFCCIISVSFLSFFFVAFVAGLFLFVGLVLLTVDDEIVDFFDKIEFVVLPFDVMVF